MTYKYFNPQKFISCNRNLVAQYEFLLPDFIIEKKKSSIDIIENTYSNTYNSTIWWFNRGVTIVHDYENIKTIEDCIALTNTRIKQLMNTLTT